MKSLEMNLVKRVERLPKPQRASEAMQPLFEAISNSIHSTQDKFGAKVVGQGRIIVDLDIDRSKDDMTATVADNGVGLDRRNFDAFTTTDTDNKIAIGGKGVGRLLWLDCFEKIEVKSIYDKNDSLRRRSFEFRLSANNQIIKYNESPVRSRGDETGMNVTFTGLKANGYKEHFPGRATYVFQHFMSHFLPTFIGGRSPTVSLTCGDVTKEFPDAISDIIYRRDTVKKESVDYGELSLILMECDKTASSDLKGAHFIHFIAHDRTVHSQRIDGKLGLKYFGDAGNRVFHACVFGKFLDKNVNQERTRFTFEDAVIDAMVNEVCMPPIEEFLNGPMQKLKKEQAKVVQEIVSSYPSVKFGTIDELQNHIPSGELDNDAIYGHLSRQRFRRDQKQAERVRDAFRGLKGEGLDDESIDKAIREASKEIEEAEQRSLAEYIVRRKVVLEFLGLLLERVRNDAKDSAYQRESVLHTFICPMRVATVGRKKEQVEPVSHDLWIVDERLTFAEYFSSDTSFDELAKEFKSTDRPDLAIFDHVHGLRESGESSKILLVEFKRPGRKQYASDENPQHQVERYIRTLQSGASLDVRGRPIAFNANTVFHCYIVADCIGAMDEWTFSWGRTADGRGRIYQPSNGFMGTIELIGWDALLSDANARNRAFFDRAGIAARSFLSETS
jgi:hypothetical protein